MIEKAVLADIRIPASARDALILRGYRVMTLPPSKLLAAPVASHPDMLLCIVKDRLFVSEEYLNDCVARETIRDFCGISKLKIIKTKTTPRGGYPCDIPFNAAVFDACIFSKTNATAPEIKDYARSLGIKTVNVSQGYTKCSVCHVGERALITADTKIAASARKEGFEVLEINPGGVTLDGYGTGFIGGATGRERNGEGYKVYFCGNLKAHPDGARMEAFCRAQNAEPISLSDEPLYDIGTMFFSN